MMIASLRARLWVIACALCLLLPIACIRFQDGAELEKFHNRTLTLWPSGGIFSADPAHYFGKARNWLADRVYPIIFATVLYDKLRYYVLHTAPQRRVSLGRNGFIFLNGGSEDTVNGLVAGACVNAHTEAAAKELENAVSLLAKFANASGQAVDVVIVPTSLTLYGNYLPKSVPPELRDACIARAAGQSPLLQVRSQAGVNVVFPLVEMEALRDDEALFPKGNWHASGLSLKIARDTYLRALGMTPRIDESLERGVAPAEILQTYGIVENLPVYIVRNNHVAANSERLAKISTSIEDLFSNRYLTANEYENSQPLIAESVLMLSDSYGDRASEVFAGAFTSVFQVRLNTLPLSNLRELIDRVQRQQHTDRLILLVQEGNVGLIADLAKALDTIAPPQSAP